MYSGGFSFAVRIACWLPDARTDPRCTAHNEDQDPMKWCQCGNPRIESLRAEPSEPSSSEHCAHMSKPWKKFTNNHFNVTNLHLYLNLHKNGSHARPMQSKRPLQIITQVGNYLADGRRTRTWLRLHPPWVLTAVIR